MPRGRVTALPILQCTEDARETREVEGYERTLTGGVVLSRTHTVPSARPALTPCLWLPSNHMGLRGPSMISGTMQAHVSGDRRSRWPPGLFLETLTRAPRPPDVTLPSSVLSPAPWQGPWLPSVFLYPHVIPPAPTPTQRVWKTVTGSTLVRGAVPRCPLALTRRSFP